MNFAGKNILQAVVGIRQVKEMHLNAKRLDFPYPVDTLPEDSSTYGSLVVYDGEQFRWNGLNWIYVSPLTLNGEAITINGSPITSIPYGTVIELNEDGTISLNNDGTVAVGV